MPTPMYMRDLQVYIGMMLADLQELCVMCVMCKEICSNINALTMICNSFTISFHNIFDERCQIFDNRGITEWLTTKTTTLVVECPMSDCWLKSS